jgi:hypothetical protein
LKLGADEYGSCVPAFGHVRKQADFIFDTTFRICDITPAQACNLTYTQSCPVNWQQHRAIAQSMPGLVYMLYKFLDFLLV